MHTTNKSRVLGIRHKAPSAESEVLPFNEYTTLLWVCIFVQ
jgi:hypothetical protein